MPAFSSPAHVLLALVSARTRRPAAVLTAELELTADLRLDSLARVELLAALRTRLPGLPEISVADVCEFRTLGDWQAALEGGRHRARYVTTTVPAPAPGLRTAHLRGPLVITDDGRRTAYEVRENLAAQGIAATVVDEVPYGATGVIFLGGLRDDVTNIHTEALHAAREVRSLFVTVQDTGGDFGENGGAATRPEAGGPAGLARHLRTEWPDSTIRALDVPRGPNAAQHITAELLHGGATQAVGYLGGVRRELVTERRPLPDPDGTTHNVIVHDAGTTPLTALRAALASDPAAKVCVLLPSPVDRTLAMNNETLRCLAAAHGWSTVMKDDEEALAREFLTKGAVQHAPAPEERAFQAEVPPTALPTESHSPLSWLIEWFIAASGATALRDVSLLRDPGAGSGPITVRGQGKRLALVSNVTHGRATIAEILPPKRPETPPAVTVRGARELGRPLEHSRTDPAATDECLRLAANWGRESFGGTAVVTSVREVRVHRTGLLSVPGKAAIHAGRVQDGTAVCDVLLMDPDGSTRIELLGVRLTRHPR